MGRSPRLCPERAPGVRVIPGPQDATVDEWLWLCKRVGAVDDQLPEGKGIHDVELSLMFAWSQMAMIDEIKDRDSYTTMVWQHTPLQ